MKKLYDYAVIGGDLRQVYLAGELAKSGSKVLYYGLAKAPAGCTMAGSLKDAIDISKTIICPIPLSRNGAQLNLNTNEPAISLSTFAGMLTPGQHFFAGCIPKAFADTAVSKDVCVFDLMSDETLTIYNTIATAEGAICEAIQKSPANLHHSKCAVLGYGRCAKTIAGYLNGMFCYVSVFARRDSDLALAKTTCTNAFPITDFISHAHEFDFIFNTIPAPVITSEILTQTKPGLTIIDIASAPGGVDYDAAKQLNIMAFNCLSLPGKYSPISSAFAIKSVIENNIKE